VRRRLFNLAAAVSLVICATIAVLWVRHRDYVLAGSRNGRVWELSCERDALGLSTAPGWRHPPIWQVDGSGNGPWRFSTYGDGGNSSEFSLCGFHYQRADSVPQVQKEYGKIDPVDPQVDWWLGYDVVPIRTVLLPYWMLLVGVLGAPAIWSVNALTRRVRRRRRSRRGCCERCAYDLTGNASGVCPECGTPVAKAGLER
jgi:hypothetical protein